MAAQESSVPCFLCKDFTYYESEKAEKLTNHLTLEHNVFFGLEFLLAGCVMNHEERIAIVNVVKNREPINKNSSEQSVLPPREIEESPTDEPIVDEDDLPLSALTPETTLQEETSENKEDLSVSPPKMKDSNEVYYHHCDECNQSFKLKIQLNRHKRSHQNNDDGAPPGKRLKVDQEVDPEEVMQKMRDKYESLKKEKKQNLEAKTNALLGMRMNLEDQRRQSLEVPRPSSLQRPWSRQSLDVPRPGSQQRPGSRQCLSRGGPKSNNTGNGSGDVAPPGTDPGPGNVCPICEKEFKSNGPMKRHFEDIHQPGEFPCPGCQRIFTSRNKVSSHYSRNCKKKEQLSL